MSGFYFSLWILWALRVSLESVAYGAFLSFCITVFLYFKQGSALIDSVVLEALGDIFLFWFPLMWSMTILLSLFRSLKHIFNTCHHGYKLQLLECKKVDVIEVVGYGDLVKVWRRWFMLLIWLTGIQMIIVTAVISLFGLYESLFDWFNVYILFLFLLISGYFSFVLIAGRCKKVKVVKC